MTIYANEEKSFKRFEKLIYTLLIIISISVLSIVGIVMVEGAMRIEENK